LLLKRKTSLHFRWYMNVAQWDSLHSHQTGFIHPLVLGNTGFLDSCFSGIQLHLEFEAPSAGTSLKIPTPKKFEIDQFKGLNNPLPTSQESKLYWGKKDYKPDHLCGAPESYDLHLSKLCSCPIIPTGLLNNASKCISRKIHQFKHICHK
jgi:hypothetical protein